MGPHTQENAPWQRRNYFSPASAGPLPGRGAGAEVHGQFGWHGLIRRFRAIPPPTTPTTAYPPECTCTCFTGTPPAGPLRRRVTSTGGFGKSRIVGRRG